jgi:hypothetical protein
MTQGDTRTFSAAEKKKFNDSLDTSLKDPRKFTAASQKKFLDSMDLSFTDVKTPSLRDTIKGLSSTFDAKRKAKPSDMPRIAIKAEKISRISKKAFISNKDVKKATEQFGLQKLTTAQVDKVTQIIAERQDAISKRESKRRARPTQFKSIKPKPKTKPKPKRPPPPDRRPPSPPGILPPGFSDSGDEGVESANRALGVTRTTAPPKAKPRKRVVGAGKLSKPIPVKKKRLKGVAKVNKKKK